LLSGLKLLFLTVQNNITATPVKSVEECVF
jgi:hypothetical protein